VTINLKTKDELAPKFEPLLDNEDRFLIMKGSAGSGKSILAAKKLIYRCLTEKKHRHLVLRKVKTDIEESVYKEIVNVLDRWGIPYEKRKHPFKIWVVGSEIIFSGLDDKERIKSITDITSITMEEMTEFTEDDFDQLNLRLRGELPYYKQTMGMFNPVSDDHWIKRRFFEQEQTLPTTLHESNYKDNPYLDDGYRDLLESYKNTNELYYQVYCLGDWGIIDTSNKFLYNFNKDTHVAPCGPTEGAPIRLSFDFNLDPFAVLIYQEIPNGLKFFDKIKLSSDIYQVCDKIRANYSNDFFIVTGDRTGWNRTGTKRGKTSYWQIIKEQLHLADPQIRLRSQNLDHVESRVLCNSALKHKNVVIDPSLTEFIKDCAYAEVDERGELKRVLIKKDRGAHKNDFLDCGRYAMDAQWPELIRKP